MSRPIRCLLENGGLVEVSTRTVQGRLLLRPTPAITQAILGVLGRAQKMYGMVVHAAVALSNHYHLILSPTSPKQLAEFMGFVNSNIAREVGRLVDWEGKFWSRRYRDMLVSNEGDAQKGRLAYLLENSIKEQLVETPFEWPGVHCASALLEDGKLYGTWFDRTAFYRAKRRQKAGDPPLRENDFKSVEVVELSPLPCFAAMPEAAQREYIQGLIAELVAKAAAQRQRAGTMVLGVERLQRQDPHLRPNKVKKSPAPRFHAVTETAWKALSAAYAEFVAAFRVASEKLRSGDRLAVFPEGSFPPALPFLRVID